MQQERYNSSELWQLLCSAAISALHWLVQRYQWSGGLRGIARKFGPDQLWSTSAEKCVLMLLQWRGKTLLWTITASVTIQQVCKAITSVLWTDDITTLHTENEVNELVANFYQTHRKFCYNAWELLTAHTLKENKHVLTPQTREQKEETVCEWTGAVWLQLLFRGHWMVMWYAFKACNTVED